MQRVEVILNENEYYKVSLLSKGTESEDFNKTINISYEGKDFKLKLTISWAEIYLIFSVSSDFEIVSSNGYITDSKPVEFGEIMGIFKLKHPEINEEILLYLKVGNNKLFKTELDCKKKNIENLTPTIKNDISNVLNTLNYFDFGVEEELFMALMSYIYFKEGVFIGEFTEFQAKLISKREKELDEMLKLKLDFHGIERNIHNSIQKIELTEDDEEISMNCKDLDMMRIFCINRITEIVFKILNKEVTSMNEDELYQFDILNSVLENTYLRAITETI